MADGATKPAPLERSATWGKIVPAIAAVTMSTAPKTSHLRRLPTLASEASATAKSGSRRDIARSRWVDAGLCVLALTPPA